MDSKLIPAPNGIYFFDSDLDQQKILDVINGCLNKAEALASTVASIDLSTHDGKTLSNYFWVLSDIIRETRWLYEKFVNEE